MLLVMLHLDTVKFMLIWYALYTCVKVLYTNIDQTLVNSLHGLLNLK